MRIGRCVFALQVFRHNNPHFQKLHSRADLRQHCVSDKFIIHSNKTTSIPFSSIKIRILNLIIKITAKILLRLEVHRSIPSMTAIGSNDGLPRTSDVRCAILPHSSTTNRGNCLTFLGPLSPDLHTDDHITNVFDKVLIRRAG